MQDIVLEGGERVENTAVTVREAGLNHRITKNTFASGEYSSHRCNDCGYRDFLCDFSVFFLLYFYLE